MFHKNKNRHEHSSNCDRHHHHSSPDNYGYAFIVAIVLNTVFVAVEFTYGVMANSTALIADAGHNLSDVLGLLLAWGATILARKVPNERYTYGLRSTSILAALVNAMLLLVACGAIGWDAIQRFSQSPIVASEVITTVAAIGIAINGFSAWLLIKGSKNDLNLRGAYLHMIADAAVSLGVVIAGVTMIFTSWYWLDSAVSLAIVTVIVFGTWQLLRDAMRLALNAVPANIDVSKINAYLRQLKGVVDIHDLHIWGMSTTENALTVHLVMPAGYPTDVFMDEVMKTLKDHFSIQHSTLQVEQGTTVHKCSL